MTPPRDGLLQMIQQNDEKHEEAHRRLRQDFDKLEDELKAQLNNGFNSLREGFLANQARIVALEKAPVDLSKVMLAPRVVMIIITLIMGIAGGFWASTYGLRSDVRDILTRMEAKNASDDNARKIMEMQVNMLRSDIVDVKKQQSLKQYDVQDLKDLLLQGKARGR